MRSVSATSVGAFPPLRGLAIAAAALFAVAISGGAALADEGHGHGTEEGSTGSTPMPTQGSMSQPSAAASVDLVLPEVMTVGEETTLKARLHGSGPVVNAQVVFLARVEFAGTEGLVELGRAITDADGTAHLAYVPRRHGDTTITARFNGNKAFSAAATSGAVSIQSGPQLYSQTAGVRVPGVSVWLLVGVLGAVWTTYFTVMLILGRIAAKSPGSTPQSA